MFEATLQQRKASCIRKLSLWRRENCIILVQRYRRSRKNTSKTVWFVATHVVWYESTQVLQCIMSFDTTFMWAIACPLYGSSRIPWPYAEWSFYSAVDWEAMICGLKVVMGDQIFPFEQSTQQALTDRLPVVRLRLSVFRVHSSLSTYRSSLSV